MIRDIYALFGIARSITACFHNVDLTWKRKANTSVPHNAGKSLIYPNKAGGNLPLIGHGPYVLSTGNIQIAGQSYVINAIRTRMTVHPKIERSLPSRCRKENEHLEPLVETWKHTYPVGIFAFTSTRPYLMLAVFRVLSLALCIGLIIRPAVELLTAEQAFVYAARSKA